MHPECNSANPRPGCARALVGYLAGHPRAFTPAQLRTLIELAGFRIAREQSGLAVEAEADGVRDRLKGRLLGVRYPLALA